MEKAFDNIKLINQYCNGYNQNNSTKDNSTNNNNQKSLDNSNVKSNFETINNNVTNGGQCSYKSPESMYIISDNSDNMVNGKQFTNTSLPSNNNISYKQRNINSDEVRVMKKVLSNEVNSIKCFD